MSYFLKICTMLSIILFSGHQAFAKIQLKDLKGTNIFPEKSEESILNPIHGLIMAEGGMLRNLYMFSFDKDEDGVKKVVKSLFNILPTEQLVVSGKKKLAYYLHPQLIGKLIGLYYKDHTLKNTRNNVKQKLKLVGKLKDNDTLYKNKLEYETDLDKKIKIKKINQEWSKLVNIYLEGSTNDRLLIISSLQALLWFQVENKDNYALYYQGLKEGMQLANEFANIAAPKKELNNDLEEEVNFRNIDMNIFMKMNVENFQNLWSQNGNWKDQEIDIASITGNESYFQQTIAFINCIFTNQVLLQQRYAHIGNISWADCGSTSLRNFIRLFLANFSDTGKVTYNVSLLESLGANEKLINYFNQRKNHDQHLTQDSRDKWGEITSGLNKFNALVKYRNSTTEGIGYEIDAGENNMRAFISSLLFNVNNKVLSWSEIETRLKIVNSNFSIEKKQLKNNLGEVLFKIKDTQYIWNFHSGHFFINKHNNSKKKAPLQVWLTNNSINSKKLPLEFNQWSEHRHVFNVMKLASTLYNESLDLLLPYSEKNLKYARFFNFEDDLNVLKLLKKTQSLIIFKEGFKKFINNADAVNRLFLDLIELEMGTYNEVNNKKLQHIFETFYPHNELKLNMGTINGISQDDSKSLSIIANLVEQFPNAKIKSLDLYIFFDKNTEISLSKIMNNAELKTLTLKKSQGYVFPYKYQNNSLARFAKDLKRNKSLKSLTLKNLDLSDNDVNEAFKIALIENTSLEYLSLEKISTIDQKNETFFESLKINTTLRTFKIIPTGNSIRTLDLISIIEKNSSLKEVDFKSIFPSKKNMKSFSLYLTNNNSVEKIKADFYKLTTKYTQMLKKALESNKTLTHLNLVKTKFKVKSDKSSIDDARVIFE